MGIAFCISVGGQTCDEHLQWLMMMDKDVDYRQEVATRLDRHSVCPSLLPSMLPTFFPPTSLSNQHDNHPPLSVGPCHLHATFTVNSMLF